MSNQEIVIYLKEIDVLLSDKNITNSIIARYRLSNLIKRIERKEYRNSLRRFVKTN